MGWIQTSTTEALFEEKNLTYPTLHSTAQCTAKKPFLKTRDLSAVWNAPRRVK